MSMNRLIRISLWSAIVGVTFLPALSHVGYYPYNIEYLLAFIFSIALGGILSVFTRFRFVSILSLLVLTAFPVALYFENFFLKSYWFLGLAFVLTTALAILAYKNFSKAIILCGLVALSQIVSSAVFGQSFVLKLEERSIIRNDIPSVVHILLDEHGSMAAIPDKYVSAKEKKAFLDSYTQNGFIVFSHAYTADAYTGPSLSRLFNSGRNLSTPKQLNSVIRHGHGKAKHIIPHSVGMHIKSSTVFEAVGQERAIDITQIKYVNFDEALKNNPIVARNLTYDVRNLASSLSKLQMKDRLLLIFEVLREWFSFGLQSPLASWIAPKINVNISRFPHVLPSQFMLQELGERLGCCGERGTYYFAHAVFPHKPYILDSECEPYPIEEWKVRASVGYIRYYAQVLCSQKTISRLLDFIKKNHKLDDAVILVHGDHGSRIEPRKKLSMRGSFLAIRIPGMDGGIIDIPVRLDYLYQNLLENDFQNFNLDKIPAATDSPY